MLGSFCKIFPNLHPPRLSPPSSAHAGVGVGVCVIEWMAKPYNERRGQVRFSLSLARLVFSLTLSRHKYPDIY